jgi:hypothetical protein
MTQTDGSIRRYDPRYRAPVRQSRLPLDLRLDRRRTDRLPSQSSTVSGWTAAAEVVVDQTHSQSSASGHSRLNRARTGSHPARTLRHRDRHGAITSTSSTCNKYTIKRAVKPRVTVSSLPSTLSSQITTGYRGAVIWSVTLPWSQMCFYCS